MLDIFLMNYITFTKINIMKKKVAQMQKTRNVYTTKKLRYTNDYQYKSLEEEEEEEEEEEKEQTSKKPNKKNHLKNQQNTI